MSKVTLELDTKVIENLVERLPLENKIQLAQKLTLETWKTRFKSLVSRIDKRLKDRQVISNERIVRIVKKVRARNYAKSYH